MAGPWVKTWTEAARGHSDWSYPWKMRYSCMMLWLPVEKSFLMTECAIPVAFPLLREVHGICGASGELFFADGWGVAAFAFSWGIGERAVPVPSAGHINKFMMASCINWPTNPPTPKRIWVKHSWPSFFQAHSFDVLIELFFFDGRPFQVLEIDALILSWLWHLEGGFEDVDAVKGGTDEEFEVDGVVAKFLYFLLALVQEHQLVGNIGLLLFVLDGHVPNGQSVVLWCHGNHWLFVGLEFDGSDGFGVPVEAKQLILRSLWAHP